MYTKSEFCKNAGITPETLRHYIDIGLLNPKEVTDKGYRKFDSGNILDLWFYRLGASLGNPLKKVKNWKSEMNLSIFHESLLEQEQQLELQLEHIKQEQEMIREICYYVEKELETNQTVSKEPGLMSYRAFCGGDEAAQRQIARMADMFPMVSIVIDYIIPEEPETFSGFLSARLGISIMADRLNLLSTNDLTGLDTLPDHDTLCMSLVTPSPFELRFEDFRPLWEAAKEGGYRITGNITGYLYCREVVGNQVYYLLKCRIPVKN